MRRPNPNVNPLRHCVIPGPRFSPRQLQLPLPSLQSTQQTNLNLRPYSSQLLSYRSQTQSNQQLNCHKRHRTLTTTPTMSSDDAYMAFLNKANADLSAGRSQETAQSQSTIRTGTLDVNAQVPASLASINEYYISETDEPFEPVVLKWEDAKRGIWPGFSQLSDLISQSGDLSGAITTLSPQSFDPKNQYASVLKAVRAAVAQRSAAGVGEDEADVEVRVYKVEVGPSRVEYFVIGLESQGGWVVGVRAKAVES